MKTISVQEAEYVAERLDQELLAFAEPASDLTTRSDGILESCLASPFFKLDKKDTHHGMIAKASILFYLMVKNYPFQNGNKRAAITTLLALLHKNGKWIRVDAQEFYSFTVWVASSPPKVKDETVKAVEKFLKAYICSL